MEKGKEFFYSASLFAIGLLVISALSTFNAPKAYAAEGGWSSYTPGTYGDFSMNYVAPGLCFRENVVFFNGELDNYSPMPDIAASIKQRTWFNLLGISYISQTKALGAHYLVNANIPYGLYSRLEVNVPDFGISSLKERKSDPADLGVGDVWITPFGLLWDFGSFHIALVQNIVLPTGNYSANQTINMGRNYTSYETDLGFTWLDEKGGHEISFIAGYMINERNMTTNYRTGDEFHVDYAVNQFFSESFALGIAGYYYQQTTKDTWDAAPDMDSYKSTSSGIGPAVMVGITKDVQVIGKWIYEYHAKNRFKGNWGMLSLAFRF